VGHNARLGPAAIDAAQYSDLAQEAAPIEAASCTGIGDIPGRNKNAKGKSRIEGVTGRPSQSTVVHLVKSDTVVRL
jgi:hypothetical protein